MTQKWQEKSFALKLDIQHLKNMARFFCNLIDNTKKPPPRFKQHSQPAPADSPQKTF